MPLAEIAGAPDAGPRVLRFEGRAMGSPLRAVIVGLPPSHATELWAAIRADVEASEQAMSRFRADSEVTVFNEHAGRGVCLAASARLYAALAAARRAWRTTSGLFDPRVIGDLEQLGYRGVSWDGRLAEVDHESRSARTWIRPKPRQRQVELLEPVDLGGIGKGLALRWAVAMAMTHRPRPAGILVDAGGDIVTAGTPPYGVGHWPIGIEDPLAPDVGHVAIVGVTDWAVCTSAPSAARWTGPDGREVHHLIDPRTGEPADTGILSVTVAAPDPAWAEVWSKSLYVVGRRQIASLARRRGLAAWWVEASGALSMTPAARQLTLWTAR